MEGTTAAVAVLEREAVTGGSGKRGGWWRGRGTGAKAEGK